ncbi:anti-sigma factor antagonist [Streptomyces sp. NPDC002589]|uniref:anti-sigma factor antagonist n=1 Tax=Streptomyces sp. NPDC002589 TaxID=3154420 RepID=UPI0033342CBE
MEHGQLTRVRARPGRPTLLLTQTVHAHRPETGAVSVLKARGTVDASHAMEFCEAVTEHIARADRAGELPVLDMTEAYVACAAAVRAVDRVTRVLAFSGRVLPVVQPRPQLRDALCTAGLPGVRVYATMAAALISLDSLYSPAAPRRASPRPGGTSW